MLAQSGRQKGVTQEGSQVQSPLEVQFLPEIVLLFPIEAIQK